MEGPLLGPPAVHGRPTWPTFRAEHPDGIVVVHPECAHEVVEVADQVGSTDFIIKAVEAAPAGLGDRASAPRSTWCSAWPPSTPTAPSSPSTR